MDIKPSVEEVKQKKRIPIVALLENVRSLYNVGSIFRSSDAILLEKLYLCGITGCPPRKEITKTALGAEVLVPWEYRDEAIKVIKELKSQGVQIVACELAHGAVKYNEAIYKFPCCFIFGHEVEGISDELMKLVDISIQVPMLGRANSLNVATCYGVVMYDALRRLGF